MDEQPDKNTTAPSTKTSTYYVIQKSNVREAPKQGGAVVAQPEPGTAIEAFTECVKGDTYAGSPLWRRVLLDGGEGYIHSSLVTDNLADISRPQTSTSTARYTSSSQAQLHEDSYGMQVDVWGALVKGRGDLVAQLERGLETQVQALGLDGVRVAKTGVAFDDPYGFLQGLQEREHIVIQQDIGSGGIATVAVMLQTYGKNDLAVAWRLFERNKDVEFRQNMWSNIVGGLAVLGILAGGWPIVDSILNASYYRNYPMNAPSLTPAVFFFIGLWLAWIAYNMRMRARDKRRMYSTATTFQQFETRLLAVSVNDLLLELLQQQGVAEHEIRVVRSSQEEGLVETYMKSP